MPAKLITVRWVCDQCGHTEDQPRVVSEVLHRCRKGGGEVKALTRKDN